MDSSLCWVRGTVSSTAVAAVDVDGAVRCGARPKGEGADAMHAETIPPKGRTRHRKFEPKASRSPSDVSKQSLSTFIKYRPSAVYPADVSNRAVLVVSLLSQCAWLVSFSSAASYNPTDAAHIRGDKLGPLRISVRVRGGVRPSVGRLAYVVQAVLVARHGQTMRRPTEMLVQTNEWQMRAVTGRWLATTEMSLLQLQTSHAVCKR